MKIHIPSIFPWLTDFFVSRLFGFVLFSAYTSFPSSSVFVCFSRVHTQILNPVRKSQGNWSVLCLEHTDRWTGLVRSGISAFCLPCLFSSWKDHPYWGCSIHGTHCSPGSSLLTKYLFPGLDQYYCSSWEHLHFKKD